MRNWKVSTIVALILSVAPGSSNLWAQVNLITNESVAFRNGTAIYFVDQGDQAGRKGDFAEAIKNFSLAIAQNPQMTEAYIKRGLVYAKNKDFTAALSDFDTAIQLDSTGESGALNYYNRALTYENLGNPEKAIEDYTHAIELMPTYIPAYKNRAVNYFRTKNYDLAWDDVQKVKASSSNIRISPDFLDMLRKESGRVE
ncbi:MAG: tetratricopeptide repeat protein [Elusimicrobia bacterium]|nr:tetratricopeptide repeat protein [Elusimicrobiota bacterium]